MESANSRGEQDVSEADPVAGMALRVLSIEQVKQVDQALTELGMEGEVRLIKSKGKLRFIQKLETRDFP